MRPSLNSKLHGLIAYFRKVYPVPLRDQKRDPFSKGGAYRAYPAIRRVKNKGLNR